MVVFNHLEEVNMSYIEHFNFVMRLLYKINIMSCKTLCHAIIPDIYVTSTTDGVENLKKQLEMRHIKSKL